MTEKLSYLHGFMNYHESEAISQVLIPGRNSPQMVPYGLYAEQLNGSAFTAPRHANLRSWLYRILPSVTHNSFEVMPHPHLLSPPMDIAFTPPQQTRWDPMPLFDSECDFIEGLYTLAGHGSPQLHMGAAIHLYAATKSMQDSFFYNADGELLIVPQEGALQFKTEFGILNVKPNEIIVIPRGIKFQVQLLEKTARGYICENFGMPLRLPELGPIGANGLANPHDFCVPIAHFENRQGEFKLIAKFQGQLWQTTTSVSPLNVVAWRGNYTPYKYDLTLFNTIGSVSFDHPDPSIFTVLTSPSAFPGVANVDFVIFPPRWMVAEQTFRPPYFHRNIMSEYMGLIRGKYDAKEGGFVPGGGCLHNCMCAHGPDSAAVEKATSTNLKPEYYDNTLAFMFESKQLWQLTPQAYNASFKQTSYLACWQNLKPQFELKYKEEVIC